MPQFQYTAVNQSGKKLSGIIGAETEDAARKELNTMKFSVLSLSQGKAISEITNPAKTSASLPIFEFEAYDTSSRKIIGTIPAQNRYKAFKRLRDEYQFEVAFVVEKGASEAEKEKAKHEDLATLKANYEAENEKPETNEEENDQSEFLKRKSVLLAKVDEILSKIRGLLTEFSDDISPENKKIVQAYVDKLLRIKSSTNLEYIEHISEELLKKIQDQELFLHKERKTHEKEKLRFETQKLMASLHQKSNSSKSITDNLSDLKEKLSENKNPFSGALTRIVEKFIPSQEVKALNDQIKSINSQLWLLWKLWLKADKTGKYEAMESIKTVKEEKARLKKSRFKLKNDRHRSQQQSSIQSKEEPVILDEINLFIGFLLCFYLIAYFVSYFSLAKIFPNGAPLVEFNLLLSPMLRNILVSLLLWHGLLNLRLHLLRYQSLSNTLVLAIGILLNTSLLFNL